MFAYLEVDGIAKILCMQCSVVLVSFSYSAVPFLNSFIKIMWTALDFFFLQGEKRGTNKHNKIIYTSTYSLAWGLELCDSWGPCLQPRTYELCCRIISIILRQLSRRDCWTGVECRSAKNVPGWKLLMNMEGFIVFFFVIINGPRNMKSAINVF